MEYFRLLEKGADEVSKKVRVTGYWMVVPCPKCETSGIDFCLECEGLCEHDKSCGRCGGWGWVVKKDNVSPFIFQFFPPELKAEYYPQKKLAQEALEYWVGMQGYW